MRQFASCGTLTGMTAYLRIPGIDAAIMFDASPSDVLRTVERAMTRQLGTGMFTGGGPERVVINFNTLPAALVTESVPDGIPCLFDALSSIPQ